MAQITHINQLSVQNFGPITTGMGKEMLSFTPVTVFIGPSGSGKSTVAKLYATLVWMEKAVSVGTITEDEAADYKFFIEKLKYHKITQYLNPNSSIHYKGFIMEWRLKGGEISFQYEYSKINEYSKILAKVQYTPADRSLLTAIDQPENLKSLSGSTFDYLIEYKRAQKNLAGIEINTLINNTKYIYDSGTDTGYIKGENHRIKTQDASSGVQSIIPIVLVNSYLKTALENHNRDVSLNEFYAYADQVLKHLRKNISLELDQNNPITLDELKGYAKNINKYDKSLIDLITNFFNPKTITHIIEEPELNLYPETQSELIYKLMADMKDIGQLVLTTHSPYLINALALSVKAAAIAKEHPEYVEDIAKIVPEDAMISSENLNIYETLADGTIRKLAYEYGIPSDNNLLNQNLEAGNTLFSQLQEIEMGWHK